jgi:hypothetical protein
MQDPLLAHQQDMVTPFVFKRQLSAALAAYCTEDEAFTPVYPIVLRDIPAYGLLAVDAVGGAGALVPRCVSPARLFPPFEYASWTRAKVVCRGVRLGHGWVGGTMSPLGVVEGPGTIRACKREAWEMSGFSWGSGNGH